MKKTIVSLGLALTLSYGETQAEYIQGLFSLHLV